MTSLTSLPVATRIKAAKWLIWGLGVGLVVRLVWLAIMDQLGANPVEFIERSTGLWALVFLLLSLTITPLRQWLSSAWLMALRRLLGLWMFALACLHILTYLWLDYSFDWGDISQDVLKHPYVIVGFLAWVISLPLALTSNQYAIRRLKQRWKMLHRSVYVLAVLALLHFFWLVKKDITEPSLYIGVFVLLMALRYLPLPTWMAKQR